MLVIENLMDLTHLPVLHRTTLADTAIPENDIPVEYRIEGDAVLVDRWVLDTPVPAYFRMLADFAPGARGRPLDQHDFHAAELRANRNRRRRGGLRSARRRPQQGGHGLESQRGHAGVRDHCALLLGPGAGLRRRRPQHQRARFRPGPQGVRGGPRGYRRPSRKISTSIRKRYASILPPTGPASRPAASSSGLQRQNDPRRYLQREGDPLAGRPPVDGPRMNDSNVPVRSLDCYREGQVPEDVGAKREVSVPIEAHNRTSCSGRPQSCARATTRSTSSSSISRSSTSLRAAASMASA